MEGNKDELYNSDQEWDPEGFNSDAKEEEDIHGNQLDTILPLSCDYQHI